MKEIIKKILIIIGVFIIVAAIFVISYALSETFTNHQNNNIKVGNNVYVIVDGYVVKGKVEAVYFDENEQYYIIDYDNIEFNQYLPYYIKSTNVFIYYDSAVDHLKGVE